MLEVVRVCALKVRCDQVLWTELHYITLLQQRPWKSLSCDHLRSSKRTVDEVKSTWFDTLLEHRKVLSARKYWQTICSYVTPSVRAFITSRTTSKLGWTVPSTFVVYFSKEACNTLQQVSCIRWELNLFIWTNCCVRKRLRQDQLHLQDIFLNTPSRSK